MNEGKLLTLKTAEAICDNTIKTTQQPQSIELKTAHKLNKENCKIDWQKNGKIFEILFVGLNPYPGAWAELKVEQKPLMSKYIKFNLKNQTTKTCWNTNC